MTLASREIQRPALVSIVVLISIVGWTLDTPANSAETLQDVQAQKPDGQEPEIQKGAKELFYDPLDRSVVSVSASGKHRSREREAGRPPTPRSADSPESTPPSTGSPSLQPAPLGLSYWLELVGSDSELGVQVTEQRLFQSGERIRLHFRSNADGYLMLIQLGASGTSSVLFPNPSLGLVDSYIAAGEDRILPGPNHWFRFDQQPGVERLLVLFAASEADLERFPTRPNMDVGTTRQLLNATVPLQGSKDLMIETETRVASEIGTYGVNVRGQPVVLEIHLQHR